MTDPPFGDWTDVYEAMIDWPKRLANEAPLFRRCFEQAGARRVVDVACGAGHHAAMFHSWGLEVVGADVDEQMIQRARDRFGQPPGLHWSVRAFDDPSDAERPSDAVVCLGNSLALAADDAMAARAMACMIGALRPGGVAIVHLLNLWRLPDGPCVWQKSLRAKLPPGEALIVKGVHRSGARGFVDLVVAPLDRPHARQCESVPLLGLEAEDVERMAQQAGATEVQRFGGYQDQPYDRRQSVDLIVVARR